MIQNVYILPKLKSLMSNGKTADIKRKGIAAFSSLKKAVILTENASASMVKPLFLSFFLQFTVFFLSLLASCCCGVGLLRDDSARSFVQRAQRNCQ
jgi:hypothetical protein